MTGLVVVGICYAAITVLFFAIGVVGTQLQPVTPADRRDFARMALTSPLWPYLLIRATTRGFATLNRLSDWKNK